MPTSYGGMEKKKGCLALGYRSEHFRIAGQMAVAIVAAMLFVVIDPVYDFLGEYVVWIVITVVVAFSPNVGSALKSAVVGLVGSIVGGAFGILVIALISALALGFNYDQHPIPMSVWACILMGLVGFVLELNKERFKGLEYGFSVALLTVPIVAIPGFRANDEDYVNRLKLMLCGCIGVLLTVLAAAVVFPARARTRLRKSTARILEDTGNLAFHLLGEFCQEPEEGMRMRGSSGSDSAQHYVDDGLQQALDGLHRAQLKLQRDVADMAALIAPARAETRYLKCKKPRFPISTYKTISRLCSRILTALASLHHSMESGHLRLGLCVVYRPLLEELRQDVAASLTALSGLVLGSLAEEYAREKMERLCAAAVELQAALEAAPMKAGYNMHVETLAIAAKTATNLARQVASIYMDLRPEVAKEIHSSLCGGADTLSAHKLSPGGRDNGGGGGGGGGSRSAAQENVPGNGQDGRSGGAGTAVQPWDVEKGLIGVAPSSGSHSSRRPPSSASLGRLTSISEDISGFGSANSQSQTLSDLQVPNSKVGSFLRSKSLPGPILIPGSVFRSAELPFSMPPPPGPAYPDEPPAPPLAPPPPAGEAPPGSGDAEGGARAPQCIPPQRPSGKQGLRELLLSHARSKLPSHELALTERQSLHPSPDRGNSGVSDTSEPDRQPQPLAGDPAGHESAPELCKMTSLQRTNSPSAWLNSRASSFKAQDNPFL